MTHFIPGMCAVQFSHLFYLVVLFSYTLVSVHLNVILTTRRMHTVLPSQFTQRAGVCTRAVHRPDVDKRSLVCTQRVSLDAARRGVVFSFAAD